MSSEDPSRLPPFEYRDSPDYKSIYANNVSFGVNSLDTVLIFGEVIDYEGSKAIIERRVRVTMTPQQLVILRDLLNIQIAQFEERSKAPIVLPPDILAQMAASPLLKKGPSDEG
jgi:hypothetical protein